MRMLMDFSTRPVTRMSLRLLGVAFVIVGIVTASYDKSFAGFMPFMWFIMALCAFIGVICSTLFRIEARLGADTGANK